MAAHAAFLESLRHAHFRRGNVMKMKDWWRQRKLSKLRGVEALDHGIVKGEGIPHLEKWKQKSEVKYWKSMPEKETFDFYMSLPTVKESPRLRSIAAFRKWNSIRKNLIATAEGEFRKQNRMDSKAELSQADQNRLNEFTKQRVQQLVDRPGLTI
jgi:hypothetical protein